MILGICGSAGAGKDTAADVLVEAGKTVKMAMADPLKRIARDVYDFSDAQLWGPSHLRNEPDPRYPRGDGYLTPRYALQILGTEWGRHCYENTWVDLAISNAQTLLCSDGWGYTAKEGLKLLLVPKKTWAVAIPDVRFKNELAAIKKAGGKVIRVLRPETLEGAASQHASEQELKEIPMGDFDYIVENVHSLEKYKAQILSIAKELNLV